MKDEWKKYLRELKVLRAKKQAGRWLPAKEAQRLEWLEERFGDAAEIERIQIDEPLDSGPKVKTADHGYATEVSEKLLKKAEGYKLTKAWEKDTQKEKRGFEARDRREGKATFKQSGLSGFAIDATEDLKGGEVGLAETPQEEEVGTKKMEHRQVVYAQDESERLTKKTESASPFALDISDGLARGLDRYKDYDQETVPDTAAKSFEVEMDEEEALKLQAPSRPAVKANQLSEELDGLLKKSYELPREKKERSEGEKSTHQVSGGGDELSTLDLLRQAVQYDDADGKSDPDAQVFQIDEEGDTLPYEEQVEDLSAALEQSDETPAATGTGETVEAQIPETGPSDHPAVLVPDPPTETPRPKKRFSDTAPTRPGVAPSEMTTQMGEALRIPDPGTSDDLAVLVPDPTADLPDLEDIEEIDPDLISEIPVDVEMEVDHSLPAEAASAKQAAVDPSLDADKFWGITQEASAEIPPQEPPTMPQQQKPKEPGPRPKRPLPALSVAPAPPPMPQPARPAARPAPEPARPAPARVDRKEIDALFRDVEEEADEDAGLVAVSPVQVRPAAKRPTGSFAPGQTQPVDIPPGPRKATVHFKDGVTRRGVISHIDNDADLIRLDPPPNSSAPAEDLVTLALKTIFLMLPRGAQPPRVNGAPVRLILIDGRSLEGVTNDYDPRKKAFTLFPKGARGNTERIIVFNDAIKNIWFD